MNGFALTFRRLKCGETYLLLETTSGNSVNSLNKSSFEIIVLAGKHLEKHEVLLKTS